MSRTPTEVSHDPIVREVNLSAEVKKIWGEKWNKPEIAYRFSGREFELRTEDAAIYHPDPQTFSLVAVETVSGGVTTWGFSPDGGSMTPAIFLSHVMYSFGATSDTETEFVIYGEVPQTFFTTLTVNGSTLQSSAATYATSNTLGFWVTQWTWAAVQALSAAGTYAVTIL